MSDEIVVSQNGQESGFVDDDRESDIFEGDVISPKYTFLAVMNNNNRQNSKLTCLLYTSPSPRDRTRSRMPSSA